MNPRHLILGIALAGALALAFLPRPDPDEDIVAPARRSTKLTTSHERHEAPVAQVFPGRPVFKTGAEANLFPSQSFRPPPPPPPKAVPLPPPPPMAPPLPFGFLGAWTENNEETVFLSLGDSVLLVRPGMKLAGGWRLDQSLNGALLFTYEPLNQQRTLRIAP
jgi:hypothetical protein